MPNGIVTSLGDLAGAKKKAAAPILNDGCYLIRYTPVEPPPEILFYEGTARILHIGADGQPKADGEAKAGGDLYCRLREFRYGRLTQWPKEALSPDRATWPNPTATPTLLDKEGKTGVIPVFPREDYRYYLEVVKILEHVPADGIVTIRFNVHAFNLNEKWPNPGTRSVALTQAVPPTDGAAYPLEPASNKPVYFAGNLVDEDSGQIVGTITMGWISAVLRRATVEIDHVKGVELPGKQNEWRDAFAAAQWQVDIRMNNPPIVEPVNNEGIWTIGQLHEALFKLRILRTTEPDVIKKAEANLGGKKLGAMSLTEIRDHILIDPTRSDLLDREWYYHLLCVRKIDGFDRGVTFDTYGADSDNVPREGSAVAAKWKFEESDKELQERWKNVSGRELQKVKEVYLRVAVHEIGHAMGLDHNHRDNGFMNTTDAIADTGLADEKKSEESQVAAFTARIQAEAIARQASPFSSPSPSSALSSSASPSPSPSADMTDLAMEAQLLKKPAEEQARILAATAAELKKKKPFPKNILEKFHPDDLNRLRFGPDVTVRPGTTFDDYGPLFADNKIVRAEGDGLELEVSPLLEAFPLGAPVRIQIKLKNNSEKNQQVPKHLSLKAGVVAGKVIDPGGTERTFWPLKKWVDGDQYATLAPDKSSVHAVTLLRGAQKALFPMPGDHTVRVTVTWERDGTKVFVEGETTVRVTPPVDENHRAAALKVISTPDTLLSLVIGGDHLTEGNDAIRAALDNPILKPHFVVVEAKRLLTRDPIVDKVSYYDACAFITGGTVLSFDEIERVYELIGEDANGAKVKKAAEKDAALSAAVKTTIGVLLSMIGKLLRQGAADADSAKALNNNLSTFRDSLP